MKESDCAWSSDTRLFLWLEQRENGQLLLFFPILYEQKDIHIVVILASPHILRFEDRIRCNGDPVSASTPNDLFKSVKPIPDQSYSRGKWFFESF
ncbi:unnamed protein product [Arabis nemorensis]|uniref:Uncharacterized protein n=1 Tax=Arabis nemorensis TaxID=586526 RepID=A0A565CT73_9BRAS|nr:unnamed protein product [Arabis nemorensis]